MNVLVCAASKHGSTAEIATRIADRLTAAGLHVDVREPSEVAGVECYDAVVLGSAVYAGGWLAPAKTLVERYADQLAEQPVWLFSSGPVGDPLVPEGEPPAVADLAAGVRARDHKVLAGKLDKSHLGLAERMIVKAMRVPEGDFRDWDAIDTWADGIAHTLSR